MTGQSQATCAAWLFSASRPCGKKVVANVWLVRVKGLPVQVKLGGFSRMPSATFPLPLTSRSDFRRKELSAEGILFVPFLQAIQHRRGLTFRLALSTGLL